MFTNHRLNCRLQADALIECIGDLSLVEKVNLAFPLSIMRVGHQKCVFYEQVTGVKVCYSLFYS